MHRSVINLVAPYLPLLAILAVLGGLLGAGASMAVAGHGAHHGHSAHASAHNAQYVTHRDQDSMAQAAQRSQPAHAMAIQVLPRRTLDQSFGNERSLSFSFGGRSDELSRRGCPEGAGHCQSSEASICHSCPFLPATVALDRPDRGVVRVVAAATVGLLTISYGIRRPPRV